MRRLRKWSLGLGVACLLLTGSHLSRAQSAPSTAGKKGGKTAPAQAVDLNTASAAELQSVPGIGAPTAKKIVAGRPYTSVADLSKIGLTSKQIGSLAPMLKVGAGGGAPRVTPASAQTKPASPVSTPPAAASTRPTAKSAKTAASSAPSGTPAPGGGRGMVWVNTETKVFHREGDKFYGTTKKGKYMTEPDAAAAGYHESKQKTK